MYIHQSCYGCNDRLHLHKRTICHYLSYHPIYIILKEIECDDTHIDQVCMCCNERIYIYPHLIVGIHLLWKQEILDVISFRGYPTTYPSTELKQHLKATVNIFIGFILTAICSNKKVRICYMAPLILVSLINILKIFCQWFDLETINNTPM